MELKKNSPKLINIVSNFIDNFVICDYSKISAQSYSIVRTKLEKKGQIIGANDLLIASHALGIGAILVTNNITNPIKDELKIVEKEVDIKKVLNSILNNLMVDNKPYISIGEVGKVMKSDYSNIKYASLKKLIEEYPKDFIIINNNYVKKY